MAEQKVYIALMSFVGQAEHSDAFHDKVLAAIGGDPEAAKELRVDGMRIIVIGREWFEKDA